MRFENQAETFVLSTFTNTRVPFGSTCLAAWSSEARHHRSSIRNATLRSPWRGCRNFHIMSIALRKLPTIDFFLHYMRYRPPVKRSETIIVILIILSIVGVSGPAILRFREAHNRTQCVDRARWLGYALNSHHDSHGSFPLGSTTSNDALTLEDRMSWYVAVLPFVEGENPVAGLKLSEPWHSFANEQIGRHRLLHLAVCPNRDGDQAHHHYGITHFVGLTGMGKQTAFLNDIEKNCGVFGYSRTTRQRDIEDGLSSTILVLEVSKDIGPWIAAGAPTLRSVDDSEPFVGLHGQFGGNHRRITTMLFADGSARQLRNDVANPVFRALVTVRGNEDISSVGD